MDHFADLITCIADDNILNQHHGIIGIRKIMSIDEKHSIQAVIGAGLIEKIINYIKQEEYPQLQL